MYFLLKKFYYAVVFLIIFFFGIFLLEFLLRLYGLGDTIIYETNISYRYAPAANQSVIRFRKSRVTINESGLRSTTEWRANDGRKLLFLGDSVTYGGSYIDDKEIFSELVCYNLNKKNKIKYICGNAGVNAYGTENIIRRIQYGKIQDEDWLIITLIEDDGFRTLQNILAIPAFIDKPKIFQGIQEILLHVTWKLNSFLRSGYLSKNSDDKKTFISLYKDNFRNLNKTLINESNKGKKILVIFHPTKESILNGVENEEYILMKNIFKEEVSKILFLDMFSIIKSSYSSDLYYDSVHLDKKGHRLFGEQILKIISEYDNKFLD